MKYASLIILLLALFALLCFELFYAKPTEIPSALIGKKIPDFDVTRLDSSAAATQFTQNDLSGRITLLNFWATWCYVCKLEHEMLLKINSEYHIPVYSILYKDDPENARQFFAEYGDPFQITGVDTNGDIGIDFGIYGTPETFVISPKGYILYRFVGLLDQNAWDKVLFPIIQANDNNSRDKV